MAVELSKKSVEEKRIRRCKRITIVAPFGEPPSIQQEFEVITMLDGSPFKTEAEPIISNVITDLFGVEYIIDGKTITGSDVASFFFMYNDRT